MTASFHSSALASELLITSGKISFRIALNAGKPQLARLYRLLAFQVGKVNALKVRATKIEVHLILVG